MTPTGKIRIERRDHPRFQVRLNVTMLKIGEEANPENPKTDKAGGQLQDLSAGGVRMFTDMEYKLGDMLALEIEIPEESGGVRGTAEVVWIRETTDVGTQGLMKYALGLKFVEIKAESQSFIAGFVQKSLEKTKNK